MADLPDLKSQSQAADRCDLIDIPIVLCRLGQFCEIMLRQQKHTNGLNLRDI